ncbi:hypothetical protein [Arthrobacter sp. 754]|uniref:hypothetical protein n=1 Tax=Arthrobacter sp. 754 TaxID=3156315 RepID=UPI0033984455
MQVSVPELGKLKVNIREIGAAPINALHVSSYKRRTPKIPSGKCCLAEIDVLEVSSLGATPRQISKARVGF